MLLMLFKTLPAYLFLSTFLLVFTRLRLRFILLKIIRLMSIPTPRKLQPRRVVLSLVQLKELADNVNLVPAFNRYLDDDPDATTEVALAVARSMQKQLSLPLDKSK